MHHHRIGFLEQTHFGGRDMDAVDGKRLFAEHAVFKQAVYNTLSIFFQGVNLVAGAFSNVYMKPGIGGGVFFAERERLVRNGKGRVQTHHSLEHVALVRVGLEDHAFVFEHGFVHFLFAVAVGDLVAEAGANAELPRRVGEGIEAAGNIIIACVMIKHGGDTVFDAIKIDRLRGEIVVFLCEQAVDLPPHAL
ncbi:hypothetical protein SDC9_146162 [bioreactor metagenome]|uniref:Uncharacterized protein n=1 Tax=bioreactor metagenome TaxID=1076179 RepID=A0A645EEE2_9ZZZZ